jgi:hypothetical protein
MGQRRYVGPDSEFSSPWEFSESSFLVEGDRERIDTTLSEARGNHLSLALVAEDGRVFTQSLLISLSDDGLLIDKPLEWDDSISTFRLFFRGLNGRWLFFRTGVTQVMPFSLSLARPREVFVLQRRSHQRVMVPQGTRAILKKDGRLLNSFYVRDLSPAGMLVCTASPSTGLHMESILNDIVISLPDNGAKLGWVLPPIDKGQVVRTFVDEESQIYCHGIAFNYDSDYIRAALGQISGIAK